jgi:transposase
MKSISFVGVDVSKATLDIGIEAQPGSVQIANTSGAIRHWLKQLPEGCYVGVESTGSYHQLLVRLTIAAGHTVYLLNTRDLSHYARAVGRRAKTDTLDAQLIARYLAREHAHLHPYQLPTELQAELDALVQRRHTAVVAQASLRQSFSALAIKPRAFARTLRAFDALISELDQRMQTVVSKDPTLAPIARNLNTMVGFGPLLSHSMANAITRHPFKHADAFIAYIGYDPRVRDSGQFRGRRFLSKRGPAELRRLLYVAAMSASKTKLWRPFYERYRARGLSSTATLVILARKLARIAFSIVKHGTVFRPELIESACAKP